MSDVSPETPEDPIAPPVVEDSPPEAPPEEAPPEEAPPEEPVEEEELPPVGPSQSPSVPPEPEDEGGEDDDDEASDTIADRVNEAADANAVEVPSSVGGAEEGPVPFGTGMAANTLGGMATTKVFLESDEADED